MDYHYILRKSPIKCAKDLCWTGPILTPPPLTLDAQTQLVL